MEIPAAWATALAPYLATPGWARLQAFVAAERARATVHPPEHLVFEALRRTPPDAVRVVLLGQDPYFNPGQACGLSFAVPPGVQVPPSLANMYKELATDLGIAPVRHGWLGPWADDGVLLLNATLTVRAGEPGSHQGQGWEAFTDAVIDWLNARERPVVFLLLGAPARKKAARITGRQHAVVEAGHPSPLAATRGFFGSRVFSRVDAALDRPVAWALPAEPTGGPDLAATRHPGIQPLAAGGGPETLALLLADWAVLTPADRLVVARAVEAVLPRRFVLSGVDGDVAWFDHAGKRFRLVAGVKRRKAVIPAFLVEDGDRAAPDLAEPADLDRHGRITAWLARYGLRLPTPEVEMTQDPWTYVGADLRATGGDPRDAAGRSRVRGFRGVFPYAVR